MEDTGHSGIRLLVLGILFHLIEEGGFKLIASLLQPPYDEPTVPHLRGQEFHPVSGSEQGESETIFSAPSGPFVSPTPPYAEDLSPTTITAPYNINFALHGISRGHEPDEEDVRGTHTTNRTPPKFSPTVPPRQGGQQGKENQHLRSRKVSLSPSVQRSRNVRDRLTRTQTGRRGYPGGIPPGELGPETRVYREVPPIAFQEAVNRMRLRLQELQPWGSPFRFEDPVLVPKGSPTWPPLQYAERVARLQLLTALYGLVLVDEHHTKPHGRPPPPSGQIPEEKKWTDWKCAIEVHYYRKTPTELPRPYRRYLTAQTLLDLAQQIRTRTLRLARCQFEQHCAADIFRRYLTRCHRSME